MATAQQIKALLRSYSEGDEDRFLSVAVQIASHAARTGKEKLAHELRELVDDAKSRRTGQHLARPVPIARPHGELAGLVSASYPKTRLSDMVLSTDAHSRLDRVVVEYRQSNKLRSHGLSPRRKLLLVGPPGCGKTMTASALAGELGLPLLFVQLHSVITKFMGETAAKLHLVFDAMVETQGVYLFDEFDAIGGQRAVSNDVGEVRRILNSFLQFLERDDSDSLILAATNLSGMLDDALFRRFDDVIEYELPTDSMRRQLIHNRLAMFNTKRLGWKTVLSSSAELSHADVVRACEDAAKDAILRDRDAVSTASLRSALNLRQKKWAK